MATLPLYTVGDHLAVLWGEGLDEDGGRCCSSHTLAPGLGTGIGLRHSFASPPTSSE